jgi:hypothetical protein
MSERTAYVRLANPRFKALVSECRGRMLDEAFGQRVAAGADAIEGLRAVMRDTDSPASTRVGAAREVIASIVKIGSHVELSERIAELERRADAKPRSQD